MKIAIYSSFKNSLIETLVAKQPHLLHRALPGICLGEPKVQCYAGVLLVLLQATYKDILRGLRTPATQSKIRPAEPTPAGRWDSQSWQAAVVRNAGACAAPTSPPPDPVPKFCFATGTPTRVQHLLISSPVSEASNKSWVLRYCDQKGTRPVDKTP